MYAQLPKDQLWRFPGGDDGAYKTMTIDDDPLCRHKYSGLNPANPHISNSELQKRTWNGGKVGVGERPWNGPILRSTGPLSPACWGGQWSTLALSSGTMEKTSFLQVCEQQGVGQGGVRHHAPIPNAESSDLAAAVQAHLPALHLKNPIYLLHGWNGNHYNLIDFRPLCPT